MRPRVVNANIVVAGFSDQGLNDPVGRVLDVDLQALLDSELSGQGAACPDVAKVLSKTLGRYTATIDWGDGPRLDRHGRRSTGANLRVTGGHTCAQAGQFPIAATCRRPRARRLGTRCVQQGVVRRDFGSTADLNGDGLPDLLFRKLHPHCDVLR